MKLTTHDYQLLQKQIIAASLPPDQFSFVKSRGRIHIKFGNEEDFNFILDRKASNYKIGHLSGQEFMTFDEVLTQFKLWLENLS